MKKKIIIAIAVIVILAAGGFFYMNHKVNSAVKDGKILNGVTCDGISVGGMTKVEAKKLIESHMKEIHKENITLYVDEEKTDVKIESLGAMADADKTVEEAYALGRTGTIFEQYSDSKKKNINLEYIVNMTKPSLRRMSRRQQKRLSQSQEMRVLNVRMESLS